MVTAKVVVRFFIKVLANFCKLICIAIHPFAPTIRFKLPSKSPALWSTASNPLVPRVIWQTNYTNKVHLAVYLNYLFNRLMAPSFEYHFVSSEGRRDFILEAYGGAYTDLYDQLQIGAAQADFWRVLVIHKIGGVYLDIDAHFVWPAELLIDAEFDELFIEIKTGEISNYFIASAPSNPNLDAVVKEIVRGIAEGTSKDVYGLTGPGVFNRVLRKSLLNTSYYAYTVNQGNFTNEKFQYIDKPQGKWTREQHQISVIRPPR